MTKVVTLSAREFIEETYRPRSESRPDLVAAEADRCRRIEANDRMIAQERRSFRQFATVIGALVALVFVGVLMLNIYEQQHMTAEQLQTLEHHFN